MLDVPDFTPEEWTALATGLQAVIVAAAAVVAGFQVHEARKLREDQTRPFVVVDFDVSDPPLIHITIANIGKTMARTVRVKVDPTLESSLDEKGRPEPIASSRCSPRRSRRWRPAGDQAGLRRLYRP